MQSRSGMWRRASWKTSLVIVVTLLECVAAYPQDTAPPEHRDWEVSGFAGRSYAGKFQFATPVTDNGQQSTRDVGLEYRSGNLVGVRIHENLNDYWAAAMEYSFAAQPVRFVNLSPAIQNLSLNQYIHHLAY